MFVDWYISIPVSLIIYSIFKVGISYYISNIVINRMKDKHY